MPESSALANFAASLLDARRSGIPIDNPGAEVGPATVEEAHVVQALQMVALGPVGAWKIAAARPGKSYKWCPIPEAAVTLAGEREERSVEGPSEIEIEIGLLLGQDVPPREPPYRPEEMRAYVASIHPCVELLSSRYADRHAVTEAQAVADLQSNLAVVVGPAIESLDGAVFTSPIQFELDGKTIPHSKNKAPLGEVLAALANLANEAAQYGFALGKGQVVITGARIGPMALSGSATLTITLDAAAMFLVQLTARPAATANFGLHSMLDTLAEQTW